MASYVKHVEQLLMGRQQGIQEHVNGVNKQTDREKNILGEIKVEGNRQSVKIFCSHSDPSFFYAFFEKFVGFCSLKIFEGGEPDKNNKAC